MMSKTLLAFIVAGSVASVASAGTVRVSDIGGGINLTSGPLGPSVFGNDQTVWTNASLASANAALNASGVATNGKITILAGDTTHGLALMALIDQRLDVEGAPVMGNVALTSVGRGDNLAYLNAAGGTMAVTPSGPISRIASGAFAWNTNGGGNGFAWAGLQTGNTMTFRFSEIPGLALGLMDPSTFQFATWNVAGGWSVVDVPAGELTFTATHDWGFSSSVVTSIPLPAGISMAGLSLLGLPLMRRRAR